MKITLKDYPELKEIILAGAATNVTEPGQNMEFNTVNNSKLYKGIDPDLDAFLKVVGGKTFPVQDFDVTGSGKVKFFSIETGETPVDGGENTNNPFSSFKFSEEMIDNVDYEGKTLWACKGCGFIVEPTVQKDHFDPKYTLAEKGIENAVCPMCFTKTFTEITG